MFFALLVLFDVLAHVYEDRQRRAKFCERIGLWCFGVAVLAEIVAYPYGQRNDTMSGNEIVSLSNLAGNADKKARQALIDASRATSDSGKALNASGQANTAASSALNLARGARQEAASFAKDIVSAKNQAAEAESHLAEALRRAQDAEIASARVADRVADRTLTPAQQSRIAVRLRQFGARRIDVIIIGDTGEIGNITALIDSAIQQAGWAVHLVGKAISGLNISGVFVGTHIGSDPSIESAASGLVSALQSEGIASRRFAPQFSDDLPMAIMGTWDNNNVAPIRMLVSAKP